MFPNVPTVALTVTATEKTRDTISNSLGMVDPVIISLQSTQTERTYLTMLLDTNIHEIEALLLPYVPVKSKLQHLPTGHASGI